MQRIVHDLLLNTYEAIGETGEVSAIYHAVRESPQVCLLIDDTGTGFLEAYLENCLFCSFTAAKPYGGGMGLYHVKAGIEAHGESIALVNREDGSGARVTVTLPEQQGIALAPQSP